MKCAKTLLLFTLLFCNRGIIAQDTILKLDGNIIIATIIDSTSLLFKCKYENIPNSAVYLIQKSELINIRYQSGRVDELNKLPILQDDYVLSPKFNRNIQFLGKGYRYLGLNRGESEILTVLSETNNEEITQLLKKVKKLKRKQYWGFIGIPFGLISGEALILMSDSFGEDENFTKITLTVAGVFALAAVTSPLIPIVYKLKRRKVIDEAIVIYNKLNN